MTSDSRQDPLLRAFDRLVRKAPAAALVVSPGHRVTVGEVAALARAAGGVLAAGGGTPGTAVGLQAANGPGFLAGLVALLRAGHPAVLFDRRTPELERRRVAGQVGAGAVLVCDDVWAAGSDDFRLETTAIGAGAQPGAAPGETAPRFPPGTNIVKLTSGSSGAARGIAVSSEALLADDLALTASMGIRVEDRLLATIPFSHSYGLSSLVVPALVRGNPLVLPASQGPFGPVAAAADAGATVFPTVPAYLAALNRLNAPPPLPPSLRLVLTAGAPLPAETSARFREVFGPTVHVFYGASESGGICYDREGGAAERGTVGAPVEGVTVELVNIEDADAAAPAGPDGGRVVVRGPALALGYLPSPDPRLDGQRYVTDDLAAWRDGELALVGRLNDLINVKGKKVDPREVERVLVGLGPVEEAAVMAAPLPGEGDGEGPGNGEGGGARRGVRVRAVVACPEGSLSAEEVVAWCRRHLADHKVPRSVVLVEALPRNERGKVDRHALGRLGATAAVRVRPPAETGARAGADGVAAPAADAPPGIDPAPESGQS